jgi:hypothetical protein
MISQNNATKIVQLNISKKKNLPFGKITQTNKKFKYNFTSSNSQTCPKGHLYITNHCL